MTNVSAGTALVHEAGTVIDEVTMNVESVNEQIGVIAVASREQSSGMEGINAAISQLQGATQQSASVVQDTAFAVMRLKEEASRLFDLVARFRVDAAAPRRGLLRNPVAPATRIRAAHLRGSSEVNCRQRTRRSYPSIDEAASRQSTISSSSSRT